MNQAARYADAAAHGGQVVTDTTLADIIMSRWCAAAAANNSSSSKMQSPRKQQQSASSPGRLVKSMSADVGLLHGSATASTAVSRTYPWPNPAAAAAAKSFIPTPSSMAAAADSPSSSTTTTTATVTPVEVLCCWLGSFLFKGSSQPVEMISFTPQVLSGRCHPAAAPGGKGVRVVQRVGVRDQVIVMLPAAVGGVAAATAAVAE